MNTNDASVLLVETAQGETVAVRFPSQEAARDWEDRHDVTVFGAPRIVSAREALALAGAK